MSLLTLLAPLVTDRTFASDWGNHLWLVSAQQHNIVELGGPSYYLQSTLGAFYPYYAFYGGSFYAVLGFAAWLTSAEAAVILAFVFALPVAYLSWTWLAVQAGIRGWLIQIPGLLAVTVPYATTNLYGRGDIPEMVATSMVPLIAASGLSLLREERLRLRSAIAFVVGLSVLTGTHTLTLVWGVVFLLVVGVIFVFANWDAARAAAGRGIRLLWLGLLGIALNAWMLVPLLAYHTRLQEGGPDPMSALEFTDRTQLFSLFRDGSGLNPQVTADVNTQLPVLLLFWAIAFGAVFWTAIQRERRKLAGGLAVVAGLVLLLVMMPSLIESLPTGLRYIQFPYRLLTYFDLAFVGVDPGDHSDEDAAQPPGCQRRCSRLSRPSASTQRSRRTSTFAPGFRAGQRPSRRLRSSADLVRAAAVRRRLGAGCRTQPRRRARSSVRGTDRRPL